MTPAVPFGVTVTFLVPGEVHSAAFPRHQGGRLPR